MLQVQVLSGFVVDLSHASNDPLENVLLLIESSIATPQTQMLVKLLQL